MCSNAGDANPASSRRLVAATHGQADDGGHGIGPEARSANYDHLFVMNSGLTPHRSLADVARERNQDSVETTVMGLALEKGMKQCFLQTIANENEEPALQMIRHPCTVVTFSDSGAHVSLIVDASLQNHLLRYRVRERKELTLEDAVRRLRLVPASYWGMHSRGLLRTVYAADMVLFDPETVAPMSPKVVHELSAAARRQKQESTGIKTTVVNGKVLMRDNEHTDALSGQLTRGSLAGV